MSRPGGTVVGGAVVVVPEPPLQAARPSTRTDRAMIFFIPMRRPYPARGSCRQAGDSSGVGTAAEVTQDEPIDELASLKG